LQRVSEVGPRVAAAIRQFFGQERNREVVRRLREAGVEMKHEARSSSRRAPLAGKSFALTGTLPHLSREEAARLILLHGGKVTSAVSRKTAFVVAGEEAGSKLEKARSLGIPILDEAAFRALVEKEKK